MEILKNVHDSFEGTEKLLRYEPIISESKLEGGVNTTRLVTLKSGVQAVFKPKDGEKVDLREGIHPGTYYNRERAAYVTSTILEFHFVPPTVIRYHNGQIGSLQLFIPDAQSIYLVGAFSGPGERAWHDRLYKLWVFDYIIWNQDRSHPGPDDGENLLVKDVQLIAYDNGLTFNGTRWSPFYLSLGDIMKAPIDVVHLLNTPDAKEKKRRLKTSLGGLLSEAEIEASVRRLSFIARELQTKGAVESAWLRKKGYNPE